MAARKSSSQASKSSDACYMVSTLNEWVLDGISVSLDLPTECHFRHVPQAFPLSADVTQSI
jgi:hypothetical protein